MSGFIGGAAGGAAGAIGGAALAATPLGWVSTGLGIIKGLGGMFGGGSDTESISSAAYSGVGGFNLSNDFDFSYRKPMIDFDDPLHIAALAGLVVVAVVVFKKVK